MRHPLLLVKPLLDETEARLERDYDVLRLFRDADRDALEARRESIRAVVTDGAAGLSRDWFDRLPALELIAVYGVGTDRIDLDLARSRGVRVATTPGVLTDDVADLAIALVLGVLRRIGEGDRLVRSGAWATGGRLALGASAKGRRLGVLGLGQIGQAVARRAEAFGMQVGWWNRSDRPADPAWRRADTPLDLAAESDVLAVCIAANAETDAMVGRDVLAALGPSGVLVNVARGSVVDEDALVAALREGSIAGAGLDVFVNEPDVRRDLAELPNVLLMPHQGSATLETRRAMGEAVLAHVAAHAFERQAGD